MSFLNHALALAEKGFHVFPLVPNSKLPTIKNFPRVATRDADKIRAWWIDPVLGFEQPFNIGISTTKFGDDQALVVVDVDNKGDKHGDDTLFELELSGKDFPTTFTQETPTGGKHLIYTNKEALKQGIDKLGNGLDIRSKGGYIVGAGSVLNGKSYTILCSLGNSLAPQWLVDVLGKAVEKKKQETTKLDINQQSAVERAVYYLENEAPESIKGQGGDQTAYKVAARLKDLGVPQDSCLDLMLEHWFEGSGWTPQKLQLKIDHAFEYGMDSAGSLAPEAQFEKVVAEGEVKKSYLEEMNEKYALVYLEGGHFIIHETIDEKGRMKRVFLTEQTFRRKFSPFTLEKGETYATSWLDWKGRREYRGVCFAPEREARNGYYNLWRGFTVEPLAYDQANPQQRRGLDLFLAHAKDNICRGDQELFTWLIGYFAHMVQRPFERPLTTVVFRGGKGVGKNALVDRVGNLMGSGHYLVAHDGRYLTSNFNAHLDSCLCLVLDEAFWSGDKTAEGKLKGITTAGEILIERKGREPYMVDNLVRLVIIGNDKWLVPASFDERRYAVYDVGNGRKQDTKFFQEMRELIDEKGGNAVLLHYLKTFDLSTVDVNVAPKTQALLDQKISSLDTFDQWWYECLTAGQIGGADFGSAWEHEVDKDRVRRSFFQYCKDHQIRSRIPDERSLGKQLKQALPSLVSNQKRREGKGYVNVYRFPDLQTSRAEWETYMGQSISWE